MFLEQFALKYHRPLIGLDESAAEILKNYRWGGNIRELQNCMEKAVILSDGTTLSAKDIQLDQSVSIKSAGTIKAISEADEERLVRDAMTRTAGNISAAAKLLGISRPTLYTKLKKYGL
jgi:DNA-binding NtrC family response regulator